MTENELYHFGVKGMKWGVRKSRSSSGSSKTKKVANKPPEAQAREKRLKKAALYGVAAASAIVTIHNLNKYKNSESMAKTVSKLAQIGTKFDKNPAGRLAREAIRSDRIAVGADIATGILQAGYGAVAVKSIYEIGKTYSGNEQRSNSK